MGGTNALHDQALSDLRVLDISRRIPGHVCTKVLADFGADVILVEPPSGDPSRSLNPFVKDLPSPESSACFRYLNNNKRGITLDPQTRTGANILLALVEWADLVVETFSPSTLPSLGLGYEAMKRRNPRVVLTSVTNFGQNGPYSEYRASEAVYYAMSGLMYVTGLDSREPVKVGANVIQFHAGIMSALHSMIALRGTALRGIGEHVDESIQELQAGSIDRTSAMLLAYQYAGFVTGRENLEGGGGSIHQCKDGYLNMFPDATMIPKGLNMLGLSELMEEPLFATMEARSMPESHEYFDALLDPWLAQRPVTEAFAAAQSARILSGPVYDSALLTADPNFSARAYWPTVERAPGEMLRMPGKSFQMYGGPWAMRCPAPTLGRHNPEIYGGILGFSREEISMLKQAGVV